MRLEISAKDLPNHIGETIFLHDEENKKEEALSNIQLKDGWVQGFNKRTKIATAITTNYSLTKIFIEV